MNGEDSVLVELSAIIESINPILEDIRANSTRANIQTTDANKKILREIAYKLRLLKEDVITLMHPIKTKQTKLFN
tara:strand:+ start:38031 stop:38255 length:225 start_codon:yes stop_codon:yes gene_type:complete